MKNREEYEQQIVNVNKGSQENMKNISYMLQKMNNIQEQDFRIIEQVIIKNIQLFKEDQKTGLSIDMQKTRQKLKIRRLSANINSVYQIGQQYVIKIQNLITDITNHQIQLMELTRTAKIKAPLLLDHGKVNGKRYLLMTKLKGEKLYTYWPLLTESQQENAISQICNELKKLHCIKFQLYSARRPINFSNLYEAILWYNDQAIKNVKNSDVLAECSLEIKQKFQKVSSFFYQNVNILKTNFRQPVFVHNDLHFGNIIYDIDRHEVTGLIDFDFSRQLEKQYELWHFIDFLLKPDHYVQQQHRQLWKQYKIRNQIELMKKYYPELFKIDPNLLVLKIKMYVVDEIMFTLQQRNFELFNFKFISYFSSNFVYNLIF